MKIISLQAENVKRIEAVEIVPKGNTVVIAGKNGQGKSSLLDAIEYAICGGKSLPPKPVRDGQDNARVRLDLGELIVERTWKGANSYLRVTSADGSKVSSPQGILDKLTNGFAFDPLEFDRLKPREQVARLQEVLGLDFKELDQRRQSLYDDRTVIGRDLKQVEAELAGKQRFDDAPEAETSVGELMAELEKRQEVNRGHERMRHAAGELRAKLASDASTIDAKAKEIADLEAKLLAARDEHAAMVKSRDEASKNLAKQEQAVAALQDADEQEIRDRLKEVDGINAKVRHNASFDAKLKECENLSGKVLDLTAQIDEIDAEKARLIGAAEFPVDGLGFNESAVTVAGIPWQQVNTESRLRVGIGMGLAQNPRLRVLLVRSGGNDLDDEHLSMLGRLAAERDCQVWIERIAGSGESAVIIEEGRVVEQVVEQQPAVAQPDQFAADVECDEPLTDEF